MMGAFAAIYLLWGSTYLALAEALRSFPPLLLMSGRCLVAGSVLLAIGRARQRELRSRESWLAASACGVCFFVGCHGVLACAQQHVPSGLAAVLLSTIPLWITALSFVVPRRERPSRASWLLLVPGTVGVGLIAGQQLVAGNGSVQPGHILLLVGAAFSWALGTVLSERKRPAESPLVAAGMELVVGGLALFCIGAMKGELEQFSTQISPGAVLGWVYLTVAGTIVAFACYLWLLDRLPAALVATYTFVNPVVAVALGWLFLAERPGIWTLSGGFLVVLSVAASVLQRLPAHRPAPSQRSILHAPSR